MFVDRVHYRVGDLLEANCSAERTQPPPSIFWFINGNEVIHVQSLTIHYLNSVMNAIQKSVIYYLILLCTYI